MISKQIKKHLQAEQASPKTQLTFVPHPLQMPEDQDVSRLVEQLLADGTKRAPNFGAMSHSLG